MEQEGNAFYIVGADSVRKKLGNGVNVVSAGGSGTAASNTGRQSFTIPSGVTKIRLYAIKDPYNINIACNGYVSTIKSFTHIASGGSGNHTTEIMAADFVVNPGATITLFSTTSGIFSLLHIAIEL